MTIFYSAFYRTLVLGLVLLSFSNSVQAASRQPIKLTADEERGEEACAKLAYEFGFATKDLLESLAVLVGHEGILDVAVFGGGGLTNEKAYALGKFTRVVLGSRLIDYNGRFCMSAAATASNRSLGLDRGLPFPLPDLAGADCVLLLGSNLAATMPPFVQHLEGVRSRGGLVVTDPRGSATAALTAEGAGVLPATEPGRAQAATESITAQADTRWRSRVMKTGLVGGRWPNCEQRAWRATFPIDGAAEPRGWPNGKFPPCRTPSRPTSGTACCR